MSTPFQSVRPSRAAAAHAISIGFVPLIDSAPLIAAFELGYFVQEGLHVRPDRQIGWGNIRDRLTYGQLHASHLPLGMVAASSVGLPFYEEPLVALMGFGLGGNAITIARRLTTIATGSSAPATWHRHLGRPLILGYVFSTASHYVCLREYLHRANLQIGRDVTLCVLPPPQMPSLLESGTIDGFCAGEPWNTLAESNGWGTIVAASTELMPDHPEKVLAVTRKWYDLNPQTAERLIHAVHRGCDFCAVAGNHPTLAAMLAQKKYLGLDEQVIERSLSIDSWLRPDSARARFRTFGGEGTRLKTESVAMLFRQMIQWGSLPPNSDPMKIAGEVIAAESLVKASAGAESTKSRTFA